MIPYKRMNPDQRKRHVHRQCIEARQLIDILPGIRPWQIKRALLDVYPDQRRLIRVLMSELFA